MEFTCHVKIRDHVIKLVMLTKWLAREEMTKLGHKIIKLIYIRLLTLF